MEIWHDILWYLYIRLKKHSGKSDKLCINSRVKCNIYYILMLDYRGRAIQLDLLIDLYVRSGTNRIAVTITKLL